MKRGDKIEKINFVNKKNFLRSPQCSIVCMRAITFFPFIQQTGYKCILSYGWSWLVFSMVSAMLLCVLKQWRFSWFTHGEGALPSISICMRAATAANNWHRGECISFNLFTASDSVRNMKRMFLLTERSTIDEQPLQETVHNKFLQVELVPPTQRLHAFLL